MPSLPQGGGNGNRATAAGAAAFSLFYLAFAWRPGILRSDDFGYIRSVIGTLERGHPWTYDWLAPYGATLSTVSALLYRATGDFLASTWGLQAFCSLLVFALLQRLLARRIAPWHAALLAAAFACGPVCLAKAADFHGGILTLALTLAALLAFGSGNAWVFFPLVFLAFANRQSHVALLALPAWAAATYWRSRFRDPRGAAASPPNAFAGPAAAALAIVFLAAAFALHSRMNLTYAMANAVFTDSGRGRLLSVALAGLAGILISLSLLALCGAAFKPPWDTLRANLRRPLAPLAATAALAAMRWAWAPGVFMTDTPMFGYLGWDEVNAALPWFLLAGIWCADYGLLRPSPYLAAIAGFIGIACLRGTWWDYYFLEILVLCLVLAAGGSAPARPAPPARLRKPALAALALLLAAETAYAYLLRIQLDKQALAVRSLERLERSGAARVDQMTGATFGQLGWKLFDHFLAHEGKDYGQLADFMGYVKRDRIRVETGLPWRRDFKSELPPSAELLESGTARIGFVSVPYRIADWRGPDSAVSVMGRSMTLDTAAYRKRILPLDNAEWDAWISDPERR